MTRPKKLFEKYLARDGAGFFVADEAEFRQCIRPLQEGTTTKSAAERTSQTGQRLFKQLLRARAGIKSTMMPPNAWSLSSANQKKYLPHYLSAQADNRRGAPQSRDFSPPMKKTERLSIDLH